MPYKISGAIIAGSISLLIGITITYIIAQFVPVPALLWALIAVAFASFFSGAGSYISGITQTSDTA